jgi:hypothetical protein
MRLVYMSGGSTMCESAEISFHSGIPTSRAVAGKGAGPYLILPSLRAKRSNLVPIERHPDEIASSLRSSE